MLRDDDAKSARQKSFGCGPAHLKGRKVRCDQHLVMDMRTSFRTRVMMSSLASLLLLLSQFFCFVAYTCVDWIWCVVLSVMPIYEEKWWYR